MNDERYEWDEVRFFDGSSRWIRGRCRHVDVVPVPALDGETVAELCLTCDEQLPGPVFRVPMVESRMGGLR